MTVTLLQWLLTQYGRAYLKGAIETYRQKQNYVPLPREALFAGHASTFRRSSAEAAAYFLMVKGYIPGAISNQDRYWVAGIYQERAAAPRDYDYTVKPSSHKALGQVCIDCHERKPLTVDFWHKTNSTPTGLHTICKSCRNKVERQRIALKRVA